MGQRGSCYEAIKKKTNVVILARSDKVLGNKEVGRVLDGEGIWWRLRGLGAQWASQVHQDR